MDSFIEIPFTEWITLIHIFGGDENITARSVLQTSIYEKSNDNNQNVKIFVPYGDKTEGFLVLLSKSNNVTQSCGLYSPKENPQKLMEAFLQTNVFDWKTSPCIYVAVKPNIKENLINLIKTNSFHVEDTIMAHLSLEKATKFDVTVPDDLVIDQIDSQYALEINNNWAPRYPGSNRYFEDLLRKGNGLGIFGRERNDLRAWIFISGRGDLHALCVKREYRGMGYAQILIKTMTKEIIRRKNEVHVYINDKNEASKNLFHSLGFQFSHPVHFVHCNLDKIKL